MPTRVSAGVVTPHWVKKSLPERLRAPADTFHFAILTRTFR